MLPSSFLPRFGPWALVTGASDGIGQAIAAELAAARVNLVLVARREVRLQTLAAEWQQRHPIQTLVLPADLTDPAAPAAIAAATAHLDLGLFVAAAGFGTSGNFVDAPLEPEIDMLAVNCRAAVALTHHFARRFADQRRGGIILLSSLVAFQGVARAAHYAATKAYIQTLAEGLALELKPHGVSVLAAAPGPVNSGFAARANMNMSMALTPDAVALATLKALGRQTTVRPGWLSQALELSLAPLPRWARSRIMQQVMAGMTQHQHDAHGQSQSPTR